MITYFFILVILLISNLHRYRKVLENVSNYLDPGSGSIIIQMVIAAIVGLGISIKVFWYKIKSKFTRTK